MDSQEPPQKIVVLPDPGRAKAFPLRSKTVLLSVTAQCKCVQACMTVHLYQHPPTFALHTPEIGDAEKMNRTGQREYGFAVRTPVPGARGGREHKVPK